MVKAFLSIWILLLAAMTPARPAASAVLFPGPGDESGDYHWQDDTIRFERLSNEQGLSVSVVNAISQDPQGFLWLGTQDGLNRYDGYSFKVYKHDPERTGSLSTNWITSLLVDRRGVLWVGTRGGGLDSYDPATGTFTHHVHQPENPNSLSNDNITALYEDSNGTLWVGTDRGLNRMGRDGAVLRLAGAPNAPEALQNAGVRAILEDRQKTLWVGSNRGLFSYTQPSAAASGSFQVFRHDPADPSSLPISNVSTILEDRFGRIWVGTRGGGLVRLADDRRRFERPALAKGSSLPDGSAIMDLYEDAGGILWIATWESGLHRLDPASGEVSVYRNQPENSASLSSDALQTIFADTSGLVWIGTYGGGVSRFDPASEKFQHYFSRPNDPNSLSSNMVWSILEDAGTLWIATDKGLDRFERGAGRFRHYLYSHAAVFGAPVDVIHALYKDQQGNLWASGKPGYLGRYDPNTDRFISYPITIPQPDGEAAPVNIVALLADRHGRLWLASHEDGLLRFEPQTGRVSVFQSEASDPNTLSSNTVAALLLGQHGRLWVGTGAGLSSLDPDTGQVRRIPLAPDIGGAGVNRREPAIQAIFEDSTGRLWIGAAGTGLLRYDIAGGEVRRYHTADGLPNETIYGILPDRHGYLWMSTNKGLSRLEPRADTFTNYDAGDGLQSNEFNSYAYAKGADGELLFGGINGVTAFTPNKIHGNTFVPPVALTSLTQSGQPPQLAAPVESLAAITLHWPNNFFEFEFAGLSFRQSDQNRYAYMLEGFDRDWVYTGANRYGRYANLPGGTYTLRIKAANNDGVWNETGKAIRVIIVPPFWQTWTFRGGLALGLILLAALGYRVRVRSMQAHNRELSRLVRERTQEIERRHQELEALYHADEEIYRNIDLDDVLHALVDTAVRLLHADKGALLVWDARRERLTARAVRGFHPETIPLLAFRPGEGVAGAVGVTGQPAWVEDVRLDPRPMRRLTDREGICAFLQTPIKVGDEIFGVFSADYLAPRAFGEEEIHLLTSLAERAALAIQNAQIHEQTQAQAIVEERSRLARELHDAVTQTLFSASLLAEALPGVYESDPDEGRALLHELRQLSRGALAEMRTLLMELRPSALAEADLGDLLRQLGEAAAGREGIPVNVEVSPSALGGAARPLPPEVHIALYRIAQEALNNTMKYAQAGQISIRLERAASHTGRAAESVSLIVQDDGCGFDPERVPSNHLGLGIMRERAEAVGAHFEVRSRSGAGTQVLVRLELPAPEAETGFPFTGGTYEPDAVDAGVNRR